MLRIVKEDAQLWFQPRGHDHNGEEIGIEFYYKVDAIPVNTSWSAQGAKALLELTDEELDDIYKSYENYKLPIEKHNLWQRDVQLIRHALLLYYEPKIQTIMPFSQFLHELLQLVPLKGMSIEDIKKLVGGKK